MLNLALSCFISAVYTYVNTDLKHWRLLMVIKVVLRLNGIVHSSKHVSMSDFYLSTWTTMTYENMNYASVLLPC